MADALLAGVDAEEAEDLATRFMAAVLAVVDFARPDPDADQSRMAAAIGIGLVEALAAFIAHPHQDEEQHEEYLAAVIARLRASVARIGAEG